MPAIILSVPRIRERQPVKAPVAVDYRDDSDGLPVLTIHANWQPRKGQFRDQDTYHVEEIPAEGGRAFLLHRDPEVVAKQGPDADDYYGVLVAANGQDHICSCRGFASQCRCKHHDAIRGLLEAGHIDEPCADRKPEQPLTSAPF